MDLETLLPTIRSLHNLPRLVAALGHQPLWGEIPQEPRTVRRVAVVGRTGELPWLALESTAPEHDAMAVARQRSKRGQVSLVLALDPERRRLALAAGLAPFPVLELDLIRPAAESLLALGRLSGAEGTGYLAFAARAADA